MENLGLQELSLILIPCLFLAATIFFLVTLQNTLKVISPQNRQMEPGQVWLLLIPGFNFFWNFIVVNAIASSLQREYQQLEIDKPPKPTYNIGLAMAILHVCTFIPVVGVVAAVGSILCWVIYWVKVNECRKELSVLHLQRFGQN